MSIPNNPIQGSEASRMIQSLASSAPKAKGKLSKAVNSAIKALKQAQAAPKKNIKASEKTNATQDARVEQKMIDTLLKGKNQRKTLLNELQKITFSPSGKDIKILTQIKLSIDGKLQQNKFFSKTRNKELNAIQKELNAILANASKKEYVAFQNTLAKKAPNNLNELRGYPNYYSGIGKAESIAILKASPDVPFLLRDSTTSKDSFVIAFHDEGKFIQRSFVFENDSIINKVFSHTYSDLQETILKEKIPGQQIELEQSIIGRLPDSFGDQSLNDELETDSVIYEKLPPDSVHYEQLLPDAVEYEQLPPDSVNYEQSLPDAVKIEYEKLPKDQNNTELASENRLSYTELPPENRLSYTELPPENRLSYTELPPENPSPVHGKLPPQIQYGKLSEVDSQSPVNRNVTYRPLGSRSSAIRNYQKARTQMNRQMPNTMQELRALPNFYNAENAPEKLQRVLSGLSGVPFVFVESKTIPGAAVLVGKNPVTGGIDEYPIGERDGKLIDLRESSTAFSLERVIEYYQNTNEVNFIEILERVPFEKMEPATMRLLPIFHDVDRAGAEQALHAKNGPLFLLRESQSEPGSMVISRLFKNGNLSEIKLNPDTIPRFIDLAKLIIKEEFERWH